jgi:molecular chaperone GrpE (heat shock protein)
MKALYNAFYTQYQPQPQPQLQPRPQPQPQPQPQPTYPPKSKGKGIVIAVVIIVAIAVAGGVFLIKSKDNNENILASEDKNSEDKDEIDSSDIEEESSISEADTEEDSSDGISDMIKEAISQADSYATQNKYADALSCIDDMKDYITSLENEEDVDTQSLDNKYDAILGKYKSYLSNTGLKYANSGDDDSVNSMFATADNYFEGDEYEQIKNNVYTYLVIANANTYIADSTNLSQGITYVRNNVEKTGYNCWVVEYLDVMREQYRVQNHQGNMTAILRNINNSYILSNSDTSYLTENDISSLSQYELYMAYFEIYARHGRTFSDSVVNDYFNGCGWYNGTIAPSSFDETQLNDCEKSNAILIYEYQVSRGYR